MHRKWRNCPTMAWVNEPLCSPSEIYRPRTQYPPHLCTSALRLSQLVGTQPSSCPCLPNIDVSNRCSDYLHDKPADPRFSPYPCAAVSLTRWRPKHNAYTCPTSPRPSDYSEDPFFLLLVNAWHLLNMKHALRLRVHFDNSYIMPKSDLAVW